MIFEKTIELLRELDQKVDDEINDFKYLPTFEVGDYQIRDGVKWVVVSCKPKLVDNICIRIETVWEKVDE